MEWWKRCKDYVSRDINKLGARKEEDKRAGRSWTGVSAESKSAQGKADGAEVSPWQKRTMEGCWMQLTVKGFFQWEAGENRKDTQKKAATARCNLLNGSAWSTERKYTQRFKGTFDIFFGIVHRMRKEKMEEQFNREAKQLEICSPRSENHC